MHDGAQQAQVCPMALINLPTGLQTESRAAAEWSTEQLRLQLRDDASS